MGAQLHHMTDIVIEPFNAVVGAFYISFARILCVLHLLAAFEIGSC